MFVGKKDNSYYLLTQSSYKGRKRYKWDYAIENSDFEMPGMSERFFDRIDNHSMRIAKEIFGNELKDYYKGHILTHIQKYCLKDINENGSWYNSYCKEKCYFTLFLLKDNLKPKEGYYWLKLSVAPRRIHDRAINKCIKYIKENVLG